MSLRKTTQKLSQPQMSEQYPHEINIITRDHPIWIHVVDISIQNHKDLLRLTNGEKVWLEFSDLFSKEDGKRRGESNKLASKSKQQGKIKKSGKERNANAGSIRWAAKKVTRSHLNFLPWVLLMPVTDRIRETLNHEKRGETIERVTRAINEFRTESFDEDDYAFMREYYLREGPPSESTLWPIVQLKSALDGHRKDRRLAQYEVEVRELREAKRTFEEYFERNPSLKRDFEASMLDRQDKSVDHDKRQRRVEGQSQDIMINKGQISDEFGNNNISAIQVVESDIVLGRGIWEPGTPLSDEVSLNDCDFPGDYLEFY